VSAPGQRPVHVPADGGESVFLVGDTYTTLLSGTLSRSKIGFGR
jgi:hypothetical protein